ncbi:M48 family metallopeptidase [Subsaximicrobium wynnwilliamsii]|uniref:M48 family metallopeptidase n=1 Tax=Subsaximicrobium wynnwilliamsii TaxID=291179 RepID=A0A5C6ZJZ3_9FLAO|nr:SprT family zinc-dependent metalloprotease [Subsaximicrobium wynnwilliamsii]TXD84947.1 M48 family metallopeptidase [Subsaximicrobium wynnwilliamsii]TXD90618.1 M48 family metallopeptidase [Subsaximicrobium wynnwilliamsii]TXE05092.1 M48 family metallopeptidase [Subsaximicrobium wynnwilliamsii]
MHKIQYGSQEIFYELKRSNRKTLGIEVHPDSSVHIIAPTESSFQDIEQKVEKRAKWIVKQQAYFEQFLPRTPERNYVSGETHYYLGKSYLLKVTLGIENQVKLKGGKLEVVCKNEIKQEQVKKLLAHWYYVHAEKKFSSIAIDAYSKFKEYDFNMPEIEIRRMAKRWGSCNTIDKVILNPEIIKASSKCIEYVLIHEMCHLVVTNHNKEFYNTLGSIMPTWKKWKDRLEQKLA